MTQETLPVENAGYIVREMIATIVAQRHYLSEVDGAIGDGDHGVNMNKGFTQCGEKLDVLESANGHTPVSFVTALDTLSETLLDDIGGSMGPLYGSFFMTMADTLRGHARVDVVLFDHAFTDAVAAVQSVGDAKVGDKTLMDTLVPARDALHRHASGFPFAEALQALSNAAESGMESTRPLQARIGRASRLGERSIGVLDAGACSCCFLIQAMVRAMLKGLDGQGQPTQQAA